MLREGKGLRGEIIVVVRVLLEVGPRHLLRESFLMAEQQAEESEIIGDRRVLRLQQVQASLPTGVIARALYDRTELLIGPSARSRRIW